MPEEPVKAQQPWASGPGEILQHGMNLLQKDSDKNRRLEHVVHRQRSRVDDQDLMRMG